MSKIRVGFNEKLDKHDTQLQTFGCRHTNPDICSKNMLNSICSFARSDNLCKSPPASWKKQFEKLNKKKGDKND